MIYGKLRRLRVCKMKYIYIAVLSIVEYDFLMSSTRLVF